MVDTFSTSNRLNKQTVGGNVDTWGGKNNDNMDLIDAALDGVLAFAMSADKTLTFADGATDEARRRVLRITSGTGGTITIPAVMKVYLVINDADGDVGVHTPSGTIVTVASKDRAILVCTGADAGNSVLLFGARRDPIEMIDQATTSGTSITLPNFAGNRNGQFLVEFRGVSHSSGSSQPLRVSLTNSATPANWRTLGTFASTASIWGAITMNAGNLTGSRGGVAVAGVFDSTATTETGAPGGVILPYRIGTAYLHIDWGGTAAFDAGSVKLWEL